MKFTLTTNPHEFPDITANHNQSSPQLTSSSPEYHNIGE